SMSSSAMKEPNFFVRPCSSSRNAVPSGWLLGARRGGRLDRDRAVDDLGLEALDLLLGLVRDGVLELVVRGQGDPFVLEGADVLAADGAFVGGQDGFLDGEGEVLLDAGHELGAVLGEGLAAVDVDPDRGDVVALG